MHIPSPRILRQVGQGQMSRSWYFFKLDIQPWGLRAKVPFIYPLVITESLLFYCTDALGGGVLIRGRFAKHIIIY